MDHYDTFYTSRTGQVITVVSGSISTISSFLILYVILRSRNGLASPYHQIMFSVGFWDIIYSLSMTLTTVPMPSDGVTKDFYKFSGKAYGNTASCDAQGFLYLLGATFSINSCISLYIYFLATIRFRMKEQTVKRRLLPFCFICSCIISIPAPIFTLYKGNINPNKFDPLCSAHTFPGNCINSNDPPGDEIERVEAECIRGDRDALEIMLNFLLIGLGIAGLTVFTIMALIFHCVFSNTLAMKRSNKLRKDRRNGSSSSDSDDEEEEQLAKMLNLQNVVLIQASMYIAAFLLCWTTPIVDLSLLRGNQANSSSDTRAVLRLMLQPLQGFFNALIFISIKAYDFKQSTGQSWLQAFLAVFKTPKEIPEMHFSNVSQVDIDQVAMEFGIVALDGVGIDVGKTGASLGEHIRGRGVNYGAQCVSWNDDISFNESNGLNSAALSMPSRSNPQSLGDLSGFSFSRQSQSQSNTEAGSTLGRSHGSGVGGEHENGRQMSNDDVWDTIGDDTGLSYA